MNLNKKLHDATDDLVMHLKTIRVDHSLDADQILYLLERLVKDLKAGRESLKEFGDGRL